MGGFHAFQSVRLSFDDDTILVHGFSEANTAALKIMVAVIDANDHERRLEGPAATTQETWDAAIEQGALEPKFKDGDSVLVVGAAISEDNKLFAWGGVSDADGFHVTYRLSRKKNPDA